MRLSPPDGLLPSARSINQTILPFFIHELLSLGFGGVPGLPGADSAFAFALFFIHCSANSVLAHANARGPLGTYTTICFPALG
jgi:hypothetical protein